MPLQNGRFSIVDIVNLSSIAHWKEEMRQAAWTPDLVVLNAGIQQDDMRESYDHAKGEQVVAVNLQGALACIGAFLPDFLARKGGGFVAITSTAAIRPSVRSAAYAASKAGLAMAFRSFRLRYAKDDVRFSTVFLGPVATEMWEGKKNALVPSVDQAAAALATFICSRKPTLWYPRLSTMLLRLSLWLPDTVFAAISQKLLR
jgi:NAD(P)-dependent dehydrogenase (short-subunit alcohol dehydrogenase family)